MEKTRSVSRCVAVAAHGRRCQQSPFRGSPYCWHHTQSRKVWAPSRPLAAGGAPVRLVSDDDAIATPPPEAAEELAAAELETARRLARALGPARAEALLRFLEEAAAEGDGRDEFTIVRESDGPRRRPSRLPRQATA